ncbi:DNA cytosine methyltransferase [Kitasatospora sp. NPDC127111]|uniref:DNA cytosine methyltransferase n=1 Tax=Kitasatospora sp. NPDC127111 TaxID=3345363 RepID=UPI00363C96FE
MPILELCAGYGGLGLAVEQLIGDQVAFVAESDPAASAVLAERFPEAPNIGDITLYDWTQLVGRVDIITAGFPCQDISNAGKREGIGGGRSGIWKNVAEAVRVIRPRFACLENVAAIRSRGLDVVAEDLAAIGYDLRWTCLRASAVGAAHHRDRWFGLATPHAPDSPSIGRAARRSEPTGERWGLRAPRGSGQLAADTGSAGLEVGSLKPRDQRSTPVGGGTSSEDADREPWAQRCATAPGQTEEGGARPHP